MSGIGAQLKHCLLLEVSLFSLPEQGLSLMKAHSVMTISEFFKDATQFKHFF